MSIKKNAALLTVLLIVFVDILGFTIMIPLLPFYAESLGASPLVVGLLASIYGLCSLIAGPILGDLSDRFGRRIILLISQIGTCISFIILALSNSLWGIFLARIIDGITSGNITVAQAYISDVTPKDQRTRAMSFIGASFGMGFILGPAISGALVHFGQSTPIWASAFLSLLSIIGTSVFLKDVDRIDNEKKKNQGILRQIKLSFNLLHTPILKEIFIVFFVFSISFALYMSGLAMYCERVLTWNEKPFTVREVGLLLSYLGVISIIIQIALMGKLIKLLGEINLMLIGFLATAAALIIMGFAPLLSIFLLGITINAFGNAILRPAISGLLSKNASPTHQGLVFGLTQTLMSIAQIICPIISGILIQKNLNFIWCLLISVFSFIGLLFGRLAKVQLKLKPEDSIQGQV